ncbi:MAG: hypothetical protein U1E15_05700 [Hyphomicrobiales bacterium]
MFRPPRWMAALGLLVIAILAFKTWACFSNPALIFGDAPDYSPAHVRALWELAGRNIAMMGLGLFVFLRPSAMGYILVFFTSLLREGADMIFVALAGDGSAAALAQAASFLVFLLPYAVALRKLTRATG